MNEDSLYTDLEKLSIKRGDTVVIFAREGLIAEEAVRLVDMLREVGHDLGVLFLVLKEGDCIKRLPEEDMNAFGWYRRCA